VYLYRTGREHPGTGDLRRPRDPLDRFLAKVLILPKPDLCWLWTGYINDSAYGVFRLANGQKQLVYAHRFAVMALAGQEIPPDHDVDHRCRVRICVFPDHLVVLPHDEHMAQMGIHPEDENGETFVPRTNVANAIRQLHSQARLMLKEGVHAEVPILHR
jgi:hypothetical protein